jgi:predicted RecB family nuclease
MQRKNFITDGVFDASLICSYKSFLLVNGQEGELNDYIELSLELDSEYRVAAEERIAQASGGHELLSRSPKCQFPHVHAAGYDIAFGVFTAGEGVKAHIDAIKKVGPRSGKGDFYYEPMLFSRNARISRIQRTSLAYRAMVLGQAQGRIPGKGMIVFGPKFSHSRIDLTPHLPKVASLLDPLSRQINNKVTPVLFLNRNCPTCQFGSHCRKVAEAADDLSLLSGISRKEIIRQNGKGIFTINQLSYTFRSRRPPKRSKPAPPPHSYALQALSLREKKIHIHGNPRLTTTSKDFYLDIEGIPDRGFYYLIGLLEVSPNGKEKYHHFWADNLCDQNAQFAKFLAILDRHNDYTLYHYGHYDKQALKHLTSNLDEIHERTEERLFNVLSIIHSHIYFPSFSNSLKEIAPLLGFRWRGTNNSGLDSIVWRTHWEEAHDPKLKARLLEYNRDDCRALRRVVDFLKSVIDANSTDEDGNGPKYSVKHTAELKSSSSLRPEFGKFDFAFKELELVNNCAYFDYQRNKVFVRTNDRVKKTNTRISPGLILV